MPIPPTPTPPATGLSTDPPAEDQTPETKKFTIKSVNTGLLGEAIQERVEVRGHKNPYKAGDEVELTDTQFKSLKEAGVKFETDD